MNKFEKPRVPRRVVTGLRNGKSVFVSDGPVPNAHHYAAIPSFDPAAADAEQRIHVPGLAEKFEAEAPGMHTTDTVDYDIVLDGEIWLELDDGAEVHLQQGDVAIQCGTRHAWRNKGEKAATMCFVLIGAQRG
jgi:mannose-6-phosphate isomerase-like protein (cupin superfamily)